MSKITNADDIVADLLLKNSDQQDIKDFTNAPFSELISLHHTLGRSIRNNYMLWSNEALCVTCQDGEAKVVHPDDASQYVIEKLHTFLNNRKD